MLMDAGLLSINISISDVCTKCNSGLLYSHRASGGQRGGLIAMMFMQYGIGKDMAICLIKAIFFSLLSVFLLMPGIIMVFAVPMEKTQHKNFIPQIPFVGKFAYA